MSLAAELSVAPSQWLHKWEVVSQEYMNIHLQDQLLPPPPPPPPLPTTVILKVILPPKEIENDDQSECQPQFQPSTCTSAIRDSPAHTDY